MSKITNDGGLTRSGRECFTAVPIWQRWASKGWTCFTNSLTMQKRKH